MNKAILSVFIKRLFDTKTNLIISTLTYYFLLAIIPTFLLLNLLLEFIHIQPFNLPFKTLSSSNFSLSFTISLLLISLYLLSRVFFTFLQTKKSFKFSLLFSLLLSLATIILLSLLILTFIIKNHFLRLVFRVTILAITLILINLIIDMKNIKYSLIFSLPFSAIINVFFYIFELFSKQFLEYENYYGLLAPLFIFILEINIVIYLIYIYYLLTETYTKISSIKFIKM